MRGVVYLGTSNYAVTVLRHLAGSAHRPQLVVTLPDRRQGRGRKLKASPVAIAAANLDLPVVKPESINSDEARTRIAAASPAVICVCAYGQLIKEPLLSDYPMLNLHPSLLPRWRGAAPIERSLMAGDSETGVTIMRLTAGLDSGPIALQRQVAIGPDTSYGRLALELAKVGGELLVEALDRLAADTLTYRAQDDGRATYAEKIELADRRLDLTAGAGQIVNRVRGLSPHIGAYLEDRAGHRIKVLRASVVSEEAKPGRVAVDDGRLLVGCGDGAIEIHELQPANGRPMSASAYLLGHEPAEEFR